MRVPAKIICDICEKEEDVNNRLWKWEGSNTQGDRGMNRAKVFDLCEKHNNEFVKVYVAWAQEAKTRKIP